MLEIVLAGGDEFPRPRHRRQQLHLARSEDDLLATRTQRPRARAQRFLGEGDRPARGIERNRSIRDEILRIRRRHGAGQRDGTLERHIAGETSGKAAFDIED